MLAGVVVAAALATACPSTPVHYGVNRDAPRSETSPWIAARPDSRRIVGFLDSYADTLGDARVRSAPGLVVYKGRPYQIRWAVRRLGGRLNPLLTSNLTVPRSGCRRLTFRVRGRRWSVVARAIEPPTEPFCGATKVEERPNPVDPSFTRWIAAQPRSSGISATFSVWIPGIEGASIYAGGRWPNGANTKVLWLVQRRYGSLLEVTGQRLDGPERFEQTEGAASSPPWAYPSIVVVPAPGCWLLTLRTGQLGGVVVFRAIAP